MYLLRLFFSFSFLEKESRKHIYRYIFYIIIIKIKKL